MKNLEKASSIGNVEQTADANDEPEVEGHYMNQFAAEQEAAFRQRQVAKSAEGRQRSDDGLKGQGIVDRIRRRFDR